MSLRVCLRLAALILGALISVSFAQAQEERVGARSEIRTFQFSGNTTFSADDLRGGLIGDADFLIAAHPLAPLQKCAQLLKAKLTRGYRAAGFPDVAVEVRVAERFEVRVTEGPRFMAGEVRISSANKISPATLIKRLTEQYPPLAELTIEPQNVYQTRTGKIIEVRPPIWAKGKPAPFGTEGFIEAQVRTNLAELGFLDSKFAVRIEKASLTQKTADLVIAFEEEGERALLSEIVIAGNRLNSRAELLDFLKLTNGMPATATLAGDTEFLLFQSGHFKKAEVKLEPIPPARARMLITLTESRVSPRINIPYSKAENGFLAFRQWLEKLGTRGEVIEGNVRFLPNLWIRFAVSPNEGMICRFEKSTEGTNYSFAFVISTNGSGMFSPRSRTKYFIQRPENLTFVTIGFHSAEEEDKTSSVELMGGFKSKASELDPNFRLTMHWEPAPFVALAHSTNGTVSFAGGTLELKSSNTVLRVEENTGKLLKLGDDAGEYSAALGDREAISKFLKETENYTNLYDEQKPSGTFLSYVIAEGFDAALAFDVFKGSSEDLSKRASAAVRKLIRPELFGGFDELLKSVEGKEIFFIPVDVDQAAAQNALAAMLAGFVFRGANVVFPENSWPWTVAREAVFVLKGQTQYTGEQLDRLFDSQEMGPVGFYVTAALLNRVQPELAKRFGLRGLTRLQGSYFEEDCKLLFDGKTALSRSVAQLAKDLQLLEADDLKAIEALFPGTGELLEKAAARGRVNARASASEMLSPLLEFFWEDHLKAVLRKELQKLAFGEEGGRGDNE